MILDCAWRALSDILAPESRAALLRTLALTLLALLALLFGLLEAIEYWVGGTLGEWLAALPAWASPEAWTGALGWVGWVLAALALGLGMAFLVAPVSAVVAGLFLDGAAEAIERRHYPADAPGRALSLAIAIPMALRFLGVVVLANLLALLLLLVPGVNAVAFLLVNGYLLGREFFDFAAMRQRPIEEARRMRRRHSGTVILAGFVLAALLAVPLINLAMPLFGAAMMVHLHKALTAREEGSPAWRGGLRGSA